MQGSNFKIKTCLNLLSIILLVFFLLMLGCGKKSSLEEKKLPGYTVTDVTGVKINLPNKPKRIISMSISTDEILLDLVETNRIVALSGIVDTEGVSNVTARAKAVKGRVFSGNMEGCLSYKPDLIIAPNFSPLEMVQTYRDMGIPIYLYRTPSTITEIQSTIKELAKVVGESEKGEIIIKKMNDKLQLVKNKTGAIDFKEQKRVVMMDTEGARFLPKSSFSNICTYAGVRDATQELAYDEACLLGQEEIVRLNPDIFMLADWNYDGEHEVDVMKKQILTNPSYQSIKASKNKAVLSIPAARLLSLSQYTADAVLDLARAVYPERF